MGKESKTFPCAWRDFRTGLNAREIPRPPDRTTTLWKPVVGWNLFLAAITAATGFAFEPSTDGFIERASPRLRVIPIVQQDPGGAPPQNWLRITSIQLQFTAFTVSANEQAILVRPQAMLPSIPVDILAARVETTIEFVSAGLAGRPRVATSPLVFVFGDPDAVAAAPTVACSFFRGYLHGPTWVLHPITSNPIFFAEYQKGARTGRVLVYDPDGSQGLRFYGEYKNDRRHGLSVVLENGQPVYVAYYQNDVPLGEWYVEWPSPQPEVLPLPGLPVEKMAALRHGQRIADWAHNLVQKCEPHIKQLVAQVFRKIDTEIKQRLAAANSVAARQRILARYAELSAAQKAFHATVLERMSGGTGDAGVYGSIAAEAREQLAAASVRNMNNAMTALSSSFEPLQRTFRQSILVVIQDTAVILQAD